MIFRCRNVLQTMTAVSFNFVLWMTKSHKYWQKLSSALGIMSSKWISWPHFVTMISRREMHEKQQVKKRWNNRRSFVRYMYMDVFRFSKFLFVPIMNSQSFPIWHDTFQHRFHILRGGHVRRTCKMLQIWKKTWMHISYHPVSYFQWHLHAH